MTTDTNSSTQSTRTTDTVFEKLCLFSIDFRQWTGSTVLTETDFRLGSDGALPPQEVVKELGQKNIFDPEKLKVFAKIKQRALRHLDANGVPFMNCIAVPVGRMESVRRALDEYVRQYEAAKADLLHNYDETVEDWIRQNPRFSKEIRAAVKPKSDVERRIYAKYDTVCIRRSPLDDEEAAQEQVNGLYERLIASVSDYASQLLRSSLEGKDCASQRVVNVLRKIRTKLDVMRFLNGGIADILKAIDTVIAHMPVNGAIEGVAFCELQLLVMLLSQEQYMNEVAEGRLTIDKWFRRIRPEAFEAPDDFTLEASDPDKPEPKEKRAKPAADPKPVPEPKAVKGVPMEGEARLFDGIADFFDEADRAAKAKDAPAAAAAEAEPTPAAASAAPESAAAAQPETAEPVRRARKPRRKATAETSRAEAQNAPAQPEAEPQRIEPAPAAPEAAPAFEHGAVSPMISTAGECEENFSSYMPEIRTEDIPPAPPADDGAPLFF